jgi:uncharacterized membrane protein YdjX (TVP38/TMEM64 family)
MQSRRSPDNHQERFENAQTAPLGLDRWRPQLLLGATLAVVMLNGCAASLEQHLLWLEASRNHPLAPVIVIAVFVMSGFVAAPLSAVMVPTIVVFGPLEGSLWTVVGATASAAIFFHLGATGSTLAGRLGARLPIGDRLGAFLEDNGIVAVAVARNLPLAPYPVVNLALGASPVGFAEFMIGNLIGLLPWVALYALTGAQVLAFLAAPSVASLVWAGLAILCIVGATLAAARAASLILNRRRTPDQPPTS